MIWLWLASGTMTLTALVHCVVGERRLITPLLAIDHPLIHRFLARRLIRFAWHVTGILMLICAALVVWPGVPNGLVIVTGAAWLGAGLIDLVMTKGQHIGWPMLTAAGLFALTGSLT